MSEAERIRALADSEEPVARDDVRRWMESQDLEILAAVYALVEKGRTELDPAEKTAFMRRYLLRCIDEDPSPNEHLHGGYEAAWELAGLLKQWRTLGSASKEILRRSAADLTTLYRRTDETTRNRILCGVLEHAFEEPELRSYFSSWQRDPDLREAYKLALDWGTTHEH
jgi:hypothetical protein